MDHSDLISELPTIEKLTPAERIQLARERRGLQLDRFNEYDREIELQTPRIKTQRIQFGAGIALLEATARNDVDEVGNLLEQGANPNSHNEDGLTPLHQCSIDNNVEMLLILLDHGADVNAQDTELWTPLHAAACCAHIQVVRHLIDKGANLLAVNADGNMPYDICDDDNTLDVIESEMAARGITQEDIDEERGSAEHHMLADMKYLYQHGASLDYIDDDGATPLHVASANGYYDVAVFLLRCGVSPSIRDSDSWTPMHAAACWSQPDIVELLDEYNADINAKTDSGETPMDLCEDETTRVVIATLQAEKVRRRRQQFPRDSRRQSRKRKSISKFQSPEQAAAHEHDSPFTARGAIRRLSLRDKSGVTLARIEAQKEQAALLRSWSLEDTTEKGTLEMENEAENKKPVQQKDRSKDTPSRRKRQKQAAGGTDERPKAISRDEWQKKLQEEEDSNDDTAAKDHSKSGLPAPPARRRPSLGKKKDRRTAAPSDPNHPDDSPPSTSVTDGVAPPPSSKEKKGGKGRAKDRSSAKTERDELLATDSNGTTVKGSTQLADTDAAAVDSKLKLKDPPGNTYGPPARSRNKRYLCCNIL